MRLSRKAGYIAGGIAVILVLFVVVTYNALVRKEEKAKQQWAEVQNTYQRRTDLIPSLVNVVKGISGFEQGTLEEITKARSKAVANQGGETINADGYNRQQRAQDSMASLANRIIISIERYPALKGTSAYLGLQTQLDGTERRIKVARKDFNEAVNSYNAAVRSFPGNLVALLFGFKPKEGFQADTGAEKAVEIKFR